MATARRMHERGIDVPRLFVGAQLLGDVGSRRAHIAELSGRTNAEIAADLIARGGYSELGDLDELRAEHVGAAYRHDCVSAHRYLIDVLDAPPDGKLPVAVTVVVAEDDPSVAGWPDRISDWELLAERVDVHELADGGHYFLRTRPVEAAEVVLQVAVR
jgi:surfactin synthase thioesterase subunit